MLSQPCRSIHWGARPPIVTHAFRRSDMGAEQQASLSLRAPGTRLSERLHWSRIEFLVGTGGREGAVRLPVCFLARAAPVELCPMPTKHPPVLVPVTNSPPRIPALAPNNRVQEARRTFCLRDEPMAGPSAADSAMPHAPEMKPPGATAFAKRMVGDGPSREADKGPYSRSRRKKRKRNEPKNPTWRYRKRGFSSKTNPNRTHHEPPKSPNEPTRRPPIATCRGHCGAGLGRPGGSSSRLAISFAAMNQSLADDIAA